MLILMGLGFVVAISENGKGNSVMNAQNPDDDSVDDFEDEDGQEIRIQKQTNNQYRLEAGGVNADCDCNLTQERVQNKTKIKVNLGNGRNAEIKIMPNTASETALARLRLKVCTEERNCTLQLKEVGEGNKTRAVYELRTMRESKVFGLFKAQMQVQAQIDAENGEVVKVKKPWWAFLASEASEE